MTEKSTHIGMFPLNILLLPGEQLPLHIFEPRYRQLFDEAKEDGFEFGLPYHDKDAGVHLVSICKLLKTVKSYETGESDVIIEATELADLKNFESVFRAKLYPGGEVLKRTGDDFDQDASDELIKLFKEYINLKYGTIPGPNQLKHYRLLDIAASMALSNKEKVSYVLLNNQTKRQAMLTQCLRYLNLLHLQESRIENGILLN